jgi:RNA polymerase sigma-70 factor (ECF subfamily)
MTNNEFDKFVNETKGVVLSAIEKYLEYDNFHYIDDIVQETYLKAYKSLQKKQFRGDSKISSWLYVIAKNESIRMNQKFYRDKNLEKKFVEYEQIKNDYNTQKKDDYKLLKELKKKVFGLPNIYRKIFNLYLDGSNENEISEKLEIPKGTVKSRLHRGKKILLKLFK